MSAIKNKNFIVKMLTVSLLTFFFLLSGYNSLATNTKTMEGMKTNLFQKLSSFPQGGKMIEIREVMSQLIELSKQDKFEQYQRTTFDILITKTRELVDGMLEEQRNEDVQYRNVTNLLMKYHLRQEHALEIVKDKHQLMIYFVQFVNSIEISGGKIDIKTDYSKMVEFLQIIISKFMEYNEIFKDFKSKFSDMYQELYKTQNILIEALKDNKIPYLSEEMQDILQKILSHKRDMRRQLTISDQLLYNYNPKMEISAIKNYIDYFQKKPKNETNTIVPMFFPSFEKETEEAKNEILVLTRILNQAEEAMKITTDSLQSNYKEYHSNVKSRRDVVEVIYQILDLMNKRARKIKGYQLKYIEEIRCKFTDFEESYEFNAYKKYIFKEPPAEEILSRKMPQLPDLTGIEDINAEAPKLESHVKLNVNNQTVINTNSSASF